MLIIEEHTSPDGLLHFIVWRDDDGDVSLGFDGYPWHTHADILAALADVPQEQAVQQFVAELVSGTRIIAILRRGATIEDVWVLDADEQPVPAEGETLELRLWASPLAPLHAASQG